MTDCCGSDNLVDAETCPDCDHVCCESCVVSASRCWCRCKFGLRGEAHSDQSTVEARVDVSNWTGYHGPFKPVLQVQMEIHLMGRYKPSTLRVEKCGYAFCGADTTNSKDPATDKAVLSNVNPTKLTNDNVDQFLVCERCQSVAYCSEQCRANDRIHRHRNPWDGFIGTHADQCDNDEPYLANGTLPYVAYNLREYHKKHGHYPNPLGKSG